MTAQRAKTPELNWQSILGPILSSARLTAVELSELTEAVCGHARRAVRLLPGVDPATLPFATQPVPWLERGRWLVDSNCRPGSFLEYAVGQYYIQDAASMLALALCQPQPGDWICDLCAAPGGKATGLLEQLKGCGLLVANEVIRSRLELLELALARAGRPNYMVTNMEVEPFTAHFSGAFNCVMVDAPCTGQTMVGRGKQTLSAFSERQMEHSAARQQRILQAAAELVRPGGRLVYSTCTFSYAENERLIAWFRQQYPDWCPIQLPELQTWSSPEHPGCYRLWPHRDGCSGGFAAGLLRPDETRPFSVSHASRTERKPPSRVGAPAGKQFDACKIAAREIPWLQFQSTTDGLQLLRRQHELHYFDQQLPASWIDVAHAGVVIAEERGQAWHPCYASSVVEVGDWRSSGQIELDDAQAIAFCEGSAVRLDSSRELPAAWMVARWMQRPLSWGKLVDGVLKNHLPKLLRKSLASRQDLR